MPVVHITDDTFEEEVKNSNLPVLVDFWAPWCGPCRMVAPTLDEISDEYAGKVKIAKLNVDENPVKTAEYKIMSIPNMKLFKNGKIVDEIVGAVPKESITKLLQKVL
jgi:thioredoxin 1